MALLPSYFYDINARLPDGRMRWFDEFADAAPSIIQSKDLDPTYRLQKNARNEAYARWQASKFYRSPSGECVPYFSPKKMIWQAVQILRADHSENNSKDWWAPFQDAVFRVFVNPETVYAQTTDAHKQWYLLSPEDGYLVNKWFMEQAGASLPPRDYFGDERYLSKHPRLRDARFVPVECCRHWRHETTAGKLPEGL